MPTAVDRLRSVCGNLGPAAARALEGLGGTGGLTRRAARWAGVVTPLGWAVAGVGVLAWIGGWQLGWRELMVVAGGCLVLVVLAAAWVVRPPALRTEVVLEPSRVEAGSPSAGSIRTRNGTSRRTLPAQIELPVGPDVAVFDVGSLPPGGAVEELFVVPTERRGVIPIGPATSVRGDPLGLFQREARSGDPYELIVHPHTTALEPFGSGLLRDLEGLTTKDLSVSDLAFHALRDYSPGDDRRYVHWRSSAKANRLLVRQFQDTRRSTLCIVVDGLPDAYRDPDEFETAVEAAASLALRACRDDLSTTLVAADQAAGGAVPHVLLDALSRARLGANPRDMAGQISRAVSKGADVSFGVVISGSVRTGEDIQRAAARFPVEVRVLAIRVVPDEPSSLRAGGRATAMQLQRLADLPGLMRAEVAV